MSNNAMNVLVLFYSFFSATVSTTLYEQGNKKSRVVMMRHKVTYSSHVGSAAGDRFLRDEWLWPSEGTDMAKMYGLGIKLARGPVSPLRSFIPKKTHIQLYNALRNVFLILSI